MAKKPIVPTGIHTEFGDVIQDEQSFRDVRGADGDLTYTPGWSDLRRARDLALAEGAQGRRDLKYEPAPTLPGQLVLARRTKPLSGQPDNSDMLTFANEGFRTVTKDDLKKDWFCPDGKLPAGATVLADGTIIKGDCAYMWCEGPDAARRQVRQDTRTREMVESIAPGADLYQEGLKRPGSDPYVEKLK